MTLLERLNRIPDPRNDINVKHDLVDVVFLVFSAVLSGATGWKSIQDFGESQIDWLRQYREFENGIPKRHCIANIISALDSDSLLDALFECAYFGAFRTAISAVFQAICRHFYIFVTY